MRHAEDRGLTATGLWAQERGEGPLVVLVHGAMDRSGGMLRVRRALEHDHRVIRYDRRGYGRSLPAGPPVTFDQQVDDLAAVLRGRQAVLVGHSFGGVVCLALAERRPDLARAVLAYEAPRMWASWWPGGSVGLQASRQEDAGDAAEWFLRRMIGDAMWERLPAAMRAERRAEGPALVAEIASVRPPRPPPYDAAAIRVPVLAVAGSASRPHHVRATDELAAVAPHGARVVLDGAGHGAHLSHAAELADLVRLAVRRADEFAVLPVEGPV
ncbi:MAG TPA: alpha/beta fold hydrolase [Acidimicrobiales bacterium]|nr:alpha/beta fold hydrolase [Acidimicrobiales bacterium]